MSIDRRGFFHWVGGGLAGAAAASLMLRDGTLKASSPAESDPPGPHFAPKAKRAIHICLCGAMSQVDSFDPKPELFASHGRSLKTAASRDDVFFGQVGRLRAPDWGFRRGGQSGLEISELFPHLRGVADELTVIRSMVADTSNHTPATFQQNSGFRLNGYPAMGSWLSYGLGSESDDLPAFVVIPDAREFPAGGAINWSNGFLPARHQGVVVRPKGTPIDDLFPSRAVPRAPTPRRSSSCSRATAGTSRPGAGKTPSRAGSRGTSWPPGCRPPSRSSPTSTPKRPRPGNCMGSTDPRPSTSVEPA